jgi:hypothetical protein
MRTLVVQRPGGPQAMRLRRLWRRGQVPTRSWSPSRRPGSTPWTRQPALTPAGPACTRPMGWRGAGRPHPGRRRRRRGWAACWCSSLGCRVRGWSPRRARSPRRCLASLGPRCWWTATPARWPERAWHAIGQELDLVADLVDHGTLAASLPAVREGGRAGSIVELAGDLEPGVDRNITLHGVLVRPSGRCWGSWPRPWPTAPAAGGGPGVGLGGCGGGPSAGRVPSRPRQGRATRSRVTGWTCWLLH